MSRLELNPVPSLQCVGMSKAYPTHGSSIQVLEHFSYDLHAGEIGMLMGPSGCGKTTLLMILGGILNADAGVCMVRGHDLFNMAPQQKVLFRAKHISFLFQQLHLFPALSALENVALPLLIDGVSLDCAKEQAKALMVRLGLELHVDSKLEILSGGQKQRVAIGRALIRAPGLILCDEPTSNLDKDSTHLIFSVIQEYAKTKGCAFLICTHDHRITHYANSMVTFHGLNDCRLTYPKDVV